MPLFAIITHGCKVNQYDSEMTANALMQEGWQRCRPEDTVDLCIINTCTVTGKASMQSRQTIRKVLRTHAAARVFVMGCYARTERDELLKIPGVHEVLQTSQPEAAIQLAAAVRPLFKRLEALRNGPLSADTQHTPPNAGRRTRPFLKIQDGCDAFCTYCIVPYARGASRSKPEEAVLRALANLFRTGYPEVVLTGIHLGRYGLDLKPATCLLKLLKRIHDAKVDYRLRLSSIEPKEISNDLIRLMATSKILQPHLHIPMQSGDDGILTQMQRPYSRAFFSDLIYRITQEIPHAAIGIDVLSGFPGEDEKAFENTFRLLRELPISYLHVFPFSPRKGTKAFSFQDQVPQPVIKERCRRLRELGQQKRIAFQRNFLGKRLPVIIEAKRDATTGLLKGITPNFITVLTPGEDHLMNTIANVRLDALDDDNRVRGTLS